MRLPGRRLARACLAYASAHLALALAVLGVVCTSALSCRAVRAVTRPPAEPFGLLFGIRSIARFMGVSRRQAWCLVRTGAIPSVDLAGVRCARKASIAAHIEALERHGAGRPS